MGSLIPEPGLLPLCFPASHFTSGTERALGEKGFRTVGQAGLLIPPLCITDLARPAGHCRPPLWCGRAEPTYWFLLNAANSIVHPSSQEDRVSGLEASGVFFGVLPHGNTGMRSKIFSP